MNGLKLIHTSDVHLGATLLGCDLGARAIVAVVDKAIGARADMLLVAGDLFDSNRVPDSLVAFTLSQLARFGKPCVLLPGNHDCLDDDSVYRRPIFRERPPTVNLIEDADSSRFFPELDLLAWGSPVVSHDRAFRPLASMPSRRNGNWHVALAHGHVPISPSESSRSSPISPEEIASAPFHYLALGHFERRRDVSQGNVKAFYSGAPLYISGSQRHGEVMLVTLDPARGVSAEPLSIEAGVDDCHKSGWSARFARQDSPPHSRQS